MRYLRSAAPASGSGSGSGMSALCDPPGAPGPPGPAPATHGPAPLSAQELSQEIKAFLTGVDPILGHQLSAREHARCGLLLLRSLPPARAAVLDHLRGVFDESVRAHLAALDESPMAGPPHLHPPAPSHVPAGGPGLEDVVQEVQQVLSEFIRANPKAWAPVISAWSIDLMGQLSSTYSGQHQRVPHATGSLNELLQLWMGCRATRTLMDIYVQCLSALIGSCPDACVDALLDTSVQHSPHFDWVVAHIGSSFPGTIISRVLSCGLKDFCVHGGAGGGAGGSGGSSSQIPSTDPFPGSPAIPGEKRVPKIASVVGILGHLASRHGDSIRRELLRMFHDSLAGCTGGRSGDPSLQATVPFLLQLAVMSPALLGTVSGELVDCLKPPAVLSQLQQHLQGFPREELDNMLNLAVHLVSQASGAGAYRLLQFLVDTAMPASVITTQGLAVPDTVREACDRLIQLLLLHLQKLVHHRGGSPGEGVLGPPPPPRPVPFLDALRNHVGELCGETLRLERKRFLWQHQLLGLLSVYTRPSCGPEALGHLLSRARSPEELSLATQLYAGLVVSLSGLLPLAFRSCLARVHAGTLQPPFTARFLRNLALLVGWEQQGGEGPAALGARFGESASAHLSDLAPLLLHPEEEVGEAAASLLAICPFPPEALSPSQLLGLVRAGVHRFFASLRLHGPPGVASASQLLTRLSQTSPAGLKAVLQLLVEGALHRGNTELFGGEADGDNETLSVVSASLASASLLDTNRRHTAAVPGPGGIWSVFHAGIIGRGLKPPRFVQSRNQQEVIYNTQSLLSLLVHCCSAPGSTECGDCWGAPTLSPEAAKAVAVTLVESVCPDAAGAELAWPPEEHARATVERDLRIGRRFREQPLLFELLKLVAAAPPALCYCSVLLRGLLAALLSHWEASRHPDTAHSPWHLEASCTLVAVMAEGSLLPPALGNMHEVFSQLAPFEVRLLLLSVWGFLREHGPLPQKFIFQSERGRFIRDFSREGGGEGGPHLAVLHSVLHRNIDRLGLFSGRFQAASPSTLLRQGT
ncbi:integrator complex subunit 5 [Molossus nigricans]